MNNTTIEVAKDLLAKGEHNRAIAVFAEAAKTDSAAFLEMADCYAQGLGVAVDNRLALKYRNLARRMEKKQRERVVREARLHRQMLECFPHVDYTHFAAARRRAYNIADCRECMDSQKEWQARKRKMRQERKAARALSRQTQDKHVALQIENAASRVWNFLGRKELVVGNAFERLVACF